MLDEPHQHCSSMSCLIAYLLAGKAAEESKNGKGTDIHFNFTASNDEIMDQVPLYVRTAIIFTPRAAIMRSVQHMVQRNVINGKSFQDESEALRELHHKRYYEQMLAYYDYCKRNADNKQPSITSFFAASTSTDSSSKNFPNPKAGEFRAGMGSGFLRDVYMAEFSCRQKHLACHLASIGGRALGGDHTFQTAKHVTQAGGEKAYEAVFDIINEFGQIVALLFTGTKSMDEIVPQLQQLYDAWEELESQVSFDCFYRHCCSPSAIFQIYHFSAVFQFQSCRSSDFFSPMPVLTASLAFSYYAAS